jgi:DNA-binding PadR family transcriptional regulator
MLEILEWLNLEPMHGYRLFQLLQSDGIATQSSEVYRVIKKMRECGLIEVKKEQPEKAKEILRLTELGAGIFQEHIRSALEMNTQLIMSGLFTQLKVSIFSFFRKSFYDLQAIRKPPKILIDIGTNHGERTIKLIIDFFEGEKVQVFVKAPGSKTRPTMFRLDEPKQTRPKLGKSLREHDADIVALFGCDSASVLEDTLKDPKSSLQYLSKKGVLCIPLNLDRFDDLPKYYSLIEGKALPDLNEQFVQEPVPLQDEIEPVLVQHFGKVVHTLAVNGIGLIFASEPLRTE